MATKEFPKTVRIPVKVVEGRIEFFYGGPLPKLKHGATGELVILNHAVLDTEHLKQLEEQRTEELFPVGTRLLAAIRRNAVPHELESRVISSSNSYVEGGLVEIFLMEPLCLRLRGTKAASLEDCQCQIPSLKESAKSVNHAYSLISYAFEPDRKSHTGNVFDLVLYESEGVWKPLRFLRESKESSFEQRFNAKRRN